MKEILEAVKEDIIRNTSSWAGGCAIFMGMMIVFGFFILLAFLR